MELPSIELFIVALALEDMVWNNLNLPVHFMEIFMVPIIIWKFYFLYIPVLDFKDFLWFQCKTVNPIVISVLLSSQVS